MWVIVKVTKTSNDMKFKVLILATLGSVYSPRLAISVMLEENDLRVRNDQ